jgi:hypothetical protein
MARRTALTIMPLTITKDKWKTAKQPFRKEGLLCCQEWQ